MTAWSKRAVQYLEVEAACRVTRELQPQIAVRGEGITGATMMKPNKRTGGLLVLGGLLLTTTAMAQIETKLKPTFLGAQDRFGSALSIDGDYAIIGAGAAKPDKDRSGIAFIYHYDGAEWVEQAQLITPSGYESTTLSFGTSVALQGDFAVIGASQVTDVSNPPPGVAFVYKRAGTEWLLHSVLQASYAAGADGFGTRVVMQGSRMLVKSDIGVYYFELEEDRWVERQKLTNEEFTSSIFGFDLCLCGDYAIMTAHSLDPVSFAIDIFHLNESEVWERQVRLFPEDLKSVETYGLALSCDGETIVVAAEGDDDQGTDAGAAYVRPCQRIRSHRTLQCLYPVIPA